MARSEQSTRAREIFEGALDIAPAEARAAYVKSACGGDVALLQRVLALLRANDVADSFLPDEPQEGTVIASIEEKSGTMIGRYKLLQKIGEGGCGVVYMAEQEEPVRRRVALKIIKMGMDTKSVIARFDAERQALAMMDHPNIAKVFDAGATESSAGCQPAVSPTASRQVAASVPAVDFSEAPQAGSPAIQQTGSRRYGPTTHSGRPYFVMELVRGIKITDYCGENNLSTRERLDLFIQVCHAVQHAHQKGIIHRDLKPSNILVTVNDGVAVPKVIDFGIAKATNQQRLTDKTVFTAFEQFIGTPAYMSPEQAMMTSLDIDTRSDIYSLGVLLYELLTGVTPFDAKELLTSGLDEMRRVIRETEPAKPSTRLTRELLRRQGREGEKEEGRSDVGPKSALRAPHSVIDRDLDWIVMKCLEKDRNRRYETANGLAADIQRHLNSEPVVARPPNTVYRMQKAIRRNKLTFAAGAAVALALLAGIGATSWQALRATHAERKAWEQTAVARRAEEAEVRERARAERRLQATLQLMNEAFEKVSPALAGIIGAAKPREDLAKAAAGIAAELEHDSELSPEIGRNLGQLYLQNSFIHAYYFANTTGDYAKGLQSALQAIRFIQATDTNALDEDRLDRLAMAQMSAGFAARGLLRPQEALDHFQQMRHPASLLRRSTNTFFAQRGLLLGRWARGLTGETLLRMDRAEEAITNYLAPILVELRSANITQASSNDVDLWDLRDILELLGLAHADAGRKQEAVNYLRQALPPAETLSRRNPDRAPYATMLPDTQAKLGEVLLALGNAEEALPLLESSLQLAEKLRQRDPANAGFVQLKVGILRNHASGYIGWAESTSATGSDRLQRLGQAREFLNRAEELVAGLKSESLRTFLRHDLNRVDTQLQKGKAHVKVEQK